MASPVHPPLALMSQLQPRVAHGAGGDACHYSWSQRGCVAQYSLRWQRSGHRGHRKGCPRRKDQQAHSSSPGHSKSLWELRPGGLSGGSGLGLERTLPASAARRLSAKQLLQATVNFAVHKLHCNKAL